MKITFLGTSCMVPTKNRAQVATAIEHRGECLLFDAGEGVQRQFQFTSIKPSKIRKIFITHWHGDHVLGLPGLLQTMSSTEYAETLRVYGPPGTKKKIAGMLSVFEFDNRMKIDIHEISEGVVLDEEEYSVNAARMDHRIETFAYSFNLKPRRRIDVKKATALGLQTGPLLGKLSRGESILFKGKKILPRAVTYLVPGKKVSFIFDTLMNESAIKLSKSADLVICEAVYTEELKNKAYEHKHLTASQAGKIAKRAGAKQLILTHVSQRYKDKSILLAEAKKVFSKTTIAKDFDILEF